jgi:DNA mismatch endonuclease (patch repair protein)
MQVEHMEQNNSWASSPGRRRNMQAIRSRDTAPELSVRRLLHSRGLRYRVAIAPLAGLRRRADIVFTKQRIAVFIDGCFWHGCAEHGRKSFRHNVDYWPTKIAINMARDLDTTARLAESGWRVLRFWEHEPPAEVASAIAAAVLEERRCHSRGHS